MVISLIAVSGVSIYIDLFVAAHHNIKTATNKFPKRPCSHQGVKDDNYKDNDKDMVLKIVSILKNSSVHTTAITIKSLRNDIIVITFRTILAPFTLRTITIKITILASTPADDIARASIALNSPARYSRVDSDWLSMFLLCIGWKKIVLKVIPTMLFLCAFIVIVVV